MKQTGTLSGRNRSLILCFFILIFSLWGCASQGQIFREEALSTEESGLAQSDRSVRPTDAEESTSPELFVHVCGCVRRPGLYRLEAGSRIMQAVEAAGGFDKKADQEVWNLAAPLEDGMQIRIPAKGEKGEKPESANDSSSLVNINTASAAELITLKGIGEGRAKDIVDYREQNGSFHRIEDIKSVPGIGPGIYEKIKEAITV